MFHARVGKPCSNLLTKPYPRAPVVRNNEPTEKCVDSVQGPSKNKYKIPKDIRYDLENALVSLCDVWFDEIKPYLVRNNIKVHVHDNASSDAFNSSTMKPNTDAREHSLLPGVKSCSHHDPATTSSSCDLCRLLFSAANSIESAVAQAASATSTATAFSGSSASPIVADVHLNTFPILDSYNGTWNTPLSSISACTSTKRTKTNSLQNNVLTIRHQHASVFVPST